MTWGAMMTIFYTLIAVAILFSFTHLGTIVYSKMFLGNIQAAIVANPYITIGALLIMWILFDRTLGNSVLIFIILLTVTIVQYPVLMPQVSKNYNTEGNYLDVVSVNLLWSNKTVNGELLNIASFNADVIMLQEYNQFEVSEETHGLLLQKYPYFYLTVNSPITGEGEIIDYNWLEKESKFGLAVYSKTPLNIIEKSGRLFMLMETEINGKKVNLMNVHTVSPVTPSRHKAWVEGFKQLEVATNKLQQSNPDDVIIFAGDFNANHNHSPFRNFVVKNNLYQNRDQTPTWGGSVGSLKILKLDHILTNSKAQPVMVRKIFTGGSDHDGVAAKIMFLP